MTKLISEYIKNLFAQALHKEKEREQSTSPAWRQSTVLQVFVFVAIVALGTSQYKQQETQRGKTQQEKQKRCNWSLPGSSVAL